MIHLTRIKYQLPAITKIAMNIFKLFYNNRQERVIMS